MRLICRPCSHHIAAEMASYEASLGIKYTEQKIEWDFWNAILYCGTIATTIGRRSDELDGRMG